MHSTLVIDSFIAPSLFNHITFHAAEPVAACQRCQVEVCIASVWHVSMLAAGFSGTACSSCHPSSCTALNRVKAVLESVTSHRNKSYQGLT